MSYHSQGLSRGLALLRVLGDSGAPLTLAQLTRALDVPKSTLVRLLAVLEEEGFVRRFGDPPAYSVGHAVHDIAESYRPPSVAEIAAPLLKRLADEVGFTANLGVIEERTVLHLHVEEPQRALRFATGGTLDFTYCTGLGKMLLSTLPDDAIAQHVPEVEPYTSWTANTITTRAQLDDALARIRRAGFSVDDEERNRGVTCMAVLVPTGDAPAIAISISAPSGELQPTDQQRLLPVLRATAADLAASPRFADSLVSLRSRMALA